VSARHPFRGHDLCLIFLEQIGGLQVVVQGARFELANP
jgi:hypothetical protein